MMGIMQSSFTWKLINFYATTRFSVFRACLDARDENPLKFIKDENPLDCTYIPLEYSTWDYNPKGCLEFQNNSLIVLQKVAM